MVLGPSFSRLFMFSKRLVAFPVGAHKHMLILVFDNICVIAWIICVLPVPGPPFIIDTGLVKVFFKASSWLSESSKEIVNQLKR